MDHNWLSVLSIAHSWVCMTPLSSAIHLAAKARHGQAHCEAPLLEHPLAVAQILMEASTHLPTQVYLVAVLHDVLESTSVTHGELEEKLGRHTAAAVAALTRWPGQSMHAFLAQIRRATTAYPFLPLVQAADLIHHLETHHRIHGTGGMRLRRETREIVLPFLRSTAPSVPPDLLPAFEVLLQRLAFLLIPRTTPFSPITARTGLLCEKPMPSIPVDTRWS